MKKQTTKLHFTGEDLRNESVKKAAEKAEKAAGKADEAKARLPSRKLRTKKASAEAEGAKLRFGKKEIAEEVKTPTALKQKVIMKGAVFSATAKAHQEVAEHEDDNVGVQAVNETEGAVETAAQTADTVRYSHKLKADKQAAKLESRADKANIEALYKKRMAENPQAATNPISRWRQKQAVKKPAGGYESDLEVAAEAGCQKGVCGDQGRTGICRNGCCIFGRKLRGGSRCRKGREGNQRYRYGRCQFYKAAQPYPSGDRRPCHGHCPDLRFFVFLFHAVRRDGKCGHRYFLYSRR